MAVKDIFKISRRTFFAPGAWLGWDELRANTIAIWDMLKTVFVPATAERKETFAEAKARLGLNDEDIKEAETNYFFYALLFVCCTVFALIVSILFLIKYASFFGCLLSMLVGVIFLSQAFRNHFLYFQIRVKKLGCTYDEWKQYLLKELGVNK